MAISHEEPARILQTVRVQVRRALGLDRKADVQVTLLPPYTSSGDPMMQVGYFGVRVHPNTPSERAILFKNVTTLSSEDMVHYVTTAPDWLWWPQRLDALNHEQAILVQPRPANPPSPAASSPAP